MHSGSSTSRAGGGQSSTPAARVRLAAALQNTLLQSLSGETAGQGLNSSDRYGGACMSLHQWPQPLSFPAWCRHACACSSRRLGAAAGRWRGPADSAAAQPARRFSHLRAHPGYFPLPGRLWPQFAFGTARFIFSLETSRRAPALLQRVPWACPHKTTRRNAGKTRSP